MDIFFMKKALHYARMSAKKGEIPVGAVIVKNGEIIAWGNNKKENGKNALLHAEIIAINKACKLLGGWRLIGCEMYVTLEPCPMCAGAIINSRIEKVHIATKDEKSGSFGGIINLNDHPFNHKPIIEYGLCEEEAKKMLKNFFVELRAKKI